MIYVIMDVKGGNRAKNENKQGQGQKPNSHPSRGKFFYLNP
jgi:hypothetical protein